jgi:protein archease
VYRWREHTGEVELEIEAAALEEVFADGLAALAELLSQGGGGEPAAHEVAIAAADLPTLFADWLNELVYLADAESFVPERVAALELEGPSLRATVSGRHEEPMRLVKAVTYHGLELRQRGNGWEARAVLDV